MSRATVQRIAAILLVAFILRLAWVSAVPSNPEAGDQFTYHSIAQNVLDGRGFHRTDSGGSGRTWPTAFVTPGYPHFLAGLYAVTGPSAAAARYANVVLGTLTVATVFVAARRLVRDDAALIAALMVALMPPLIIWTSVVMAVTLGAFVFSVCVALILWSRAGPRIDLRLVLLAAICLGLATHVRSEALVLAPVALVWLAYAGRDTPRLLPAALLVMLVTVAVVAPWSVRNYLVLDSLIVTSSSAGDNVYGGHSDCANGTWVRGCTLNWPQPGRETEIEVYAAEEGVRRGFRYALTHPIREVELTVRKLFWLWKPSTDAVDSASTSTSEISEVRMPMKLVVGLYGVGFGLLIISGLLRQPREVMLPFAVLIVLFSLSFVPFVAISRYSVPVLPALAILAAAELVRILDLRRYRSTVADPVSATSAAAAP